MLKHLRFYTILSIFFIISTHKLNAQKLTVSDSLSQILIDKEKEMFDAISNGDKPLAENLFGVDYITMQMAQCRARRKQ